jgi:hypothetical protein
MKVRSGSVGPIARLLQEGLKAFRHKKPGLTCVLVLACCGGPKPREEPPPELRPELGPGCSGCPTIEDFTVEIVPETVYTTPGTKFQLEAVARSAGNPLLTLPDPVAWSGSLDKSPDNASPTIVTAPDGDKADLEVKVRGIPSPKAHVIMRSSDDAPHDKLTLKLDPTVPVPVALIDAQPFGKTCSEGNDMKFAIAGTAHLNVNLTTGCPSKLAIFTVGHALQFERACTGAANQQAASAQPGDEGCALDPWSNRSDSVVREQPPAPLAMHLAIWYRVKAPGLTSGDGDPRSEGAIASGIATDIFRVRRAGIVLEIDAESGDLGAETVFHVTDAACSTAEEELRFTARPDRVNVVYVQELHFGGRIRGLTCARPGMSPIVLIDWIKDADATLAHELGHVLGLSSQEFPDHPYGHTTGLTQFDDSNLMSPFERPLRDRDYLTLGQVFRFNVDNRSWINRGPESRTGAREECQAQRFSATPCPPLDLDVRTP